MNAKPALTLTQTVSPQHYTKNRDQSGRIFAILRKSSFPTLFISGYYLFALSPGKIFHGVDFVLISKILMLFAATVGVFSRRVILSNIIILSIAAIALIFSGLFTSNTSFSWGVWAASATNIVTPLLFLSILYNVSDKKTLLHWVAWAPIVSLFFGIGYDFLGHASVFGSGPRLQGPLIASFYAGLCLNGSIAAFGVSIKDKRFIALVALNLLLLILTAARMPILIAGILSAYIFFTQVRMKFSLKITISAFSVLGLFTFLLLFGETLLSRFESGDSGRSVLWSHYMSLYRLYPDFGYGLGQSAETVPRSIALKSGFIVAAHNEYIRLLCEIGTACALILLLSISIGFLNAAILSHRRNALAFLALFSILLFCYTDNIFLSPVYYPLMIIVACFPRKHANRNFYGEIS